MKAALASIIMAIGTTQASAQAESVYVPSDPRATYGMIVRDMGMGPSALMVITRREGSSGTTFSLREVNCLSRTFRYMGEGFTLDEAIANVHDDDPMAVPVQGSISYHIVNAACD